jgi:(p)ppGpp synthase/HD superfamily hydrolase
MKTVQLLKENLSKLRKTYLKKLKSSLSKSEVKQIAKDLKRLNIMPKGKLKHSIRVSDRLVDLDVDKDVILGALFHDYIERGGDVDDLSISEDTKDIVRFLSSFDDTFASSDNEPLEHLIHVFGRIDNQELKNQLVMIKLSDRVDNLNRRGKSVSKGYLKKSIALLKFLMSNYTGSVDLGKLLMALNRKLHKKVAKKVRVTESQYILLFQ